MIAFGCAIGSPHVYERRAGAGIRRAAEPDSEVLVQMAVGSLAKSWNLLIDRAQSLEGLEALVLLHEHAEIANPAFPALLRDAIGDDDVALAGQVGAVGARTIAWWEGAVTWATFASSHREFSADRVPQITWNRKPVAPEAPLGEVDTLYGFVIVLSPWAIRNLRFDEALDALHGLDFDLCLQAREAGRKVVAAELGVVFHHPLEIVTDPEAWMEAHMLVSEKWEARFPHVEPEGGSWDRRARRAEAEAGAARLAGASKLLQAYAGADDHNVSREELLSTRSWQLTEPLRRLNSFRRSRLSRRGLDESPRG